MANDLRSLVAIFESDSNANPMRGIARVVDDALANKVIDAWLDDSFCEWERPKGGRPTGELGELWNWLWSETYIDSEKLAGAVGASQTEIEPKILMLLSARMLYPDGSISPTAAKLVNAYSASKLPKKRKAKS